MCYFLYGAINNGLNIADYEKIMKDTSYYFNVGSIKDVNKCVAERDRSYRITQSICDCENAIGQKKPDRKELEELKDLLLNLQKVRGIKHILISKNWWKETNTKVETVHIEDIDIINFLANIEDNCLYKVELYKKYY